MDRDNYNRTRSREIWKGRKLNTKWRWYLLQMMHLRSEALFKENVSLFPLRTGRVQQKILAGHFVGLRLEAVPRGFTTSNRLTRLSAGRREYPKLKSEEVKVMEIRVYSSKIANRVPRQEATSKYDSNKITNQKEGGCWIDKRWYPESGRGPISGWKAQVHRNKSFDKILR